MPTDHENDARIAREKAAREAAIQEAAEKEQERLRQQEEPSGSPEPGQ